MDKENIKKRKSAHVEASASQAGDSAPVLARETVENDRKKRGLPFGMAVPAIAAVAVLTAGIVASSISLGFFGSETHEAFIATPQSAAELAAPQGIFLEGISVGGVDLGGMTMKAAKDMLSRALKISDDCCGLVQRIFPDMGSAAAQKLFALGAAAEDLYVLGFGALSERAGGSDWRHTPVMI